MTPRRSKIAEGDPIVPVQQLVSAGLHERDVYIAAALSGAQCAWDRQSDRFLMTPAEVADRACLIADAVMERKESTT